MSINKKKSKLIIDLIDELNHSIDYVILRGYESIPNNITGDIDLLISKDSFFTFNKIISDLKQKHELYELDNVDRHYVYMYRLFHLELNQNYGLKIDIHFFESYRGAIYLDSKTILSNAISYSGIKIPCYEHQVIFNYVQSIAGMGYLQEKRIKRILNQLELCDLNSLEETIKKVFRKKASLILIKAFKTKKFSITQKDLKSLRRSILVKAYLNNFVGSLISFILIFGKKQLINLKLKGVFIVFMGPDGAGKSTAINAFINFLSQFVINSESVLVAWRPQYLKRLANYRKNNNPLDKATKAEKVRNIPSKVSSFFRFVYYSIDYILGYFLKYRKILKNEGFVIFDRYSYDFIIQPPYRSYINLPKFIKLFFGFFIPKPKLVIYFKSDAETLYSRKQEETRNELEELVGLYDAFVENHKRIKPIDANKSKEIVLQQICENFKLSYGR